jgi:hypothetical protein
VKLKKLSLLLSLLLVLVSLNSVRPAHGAQSGPCFTTLKSCPARGCANPGTTDALVNELKRTKPTGDTVAILTLDDFEFLQDQASDLVGQNKSLAKTTRNKLRQLELRSSAEVVNEGDLIQLIGFIVGLPHRPKASGPESVNCRLTGTRNNDFHIPIAVHPDDTEFEGIVVEMIPQDRPKGWTTTKLRWVAREKLPVAVRGQLFYDNKHLVNDDSDNVKAGQPKRFSLWEIHPVTEFYVCMRPNKKCNRKDITEWELLEDVETQ